jgi:hypothetical protein
MAEPDPPPRCTAADIAAVLAAAAQPQSRVILDHPLDDLLGCIRLETDRLWTIELWRDGAQLQHVMTAQAPDGRTWQRGCQRHWTTTGEVIEPLELLDSAQRMALQQRLAAAVCWPAPEHDDSAAPEMVLRDEVIKPRRSYRRGAR